MKVYDEASSGAVLSAHQLRRDSTEAEKRLWLRRLAKRAGIVALTLIALDLIATTATLALGVELFRK
jgi:hypothetical protein